MRFRVARSLGADTRSLDRRHERKFVRFNCQVRDARARESPPCCRGIETTHRTDIAEAESLIVAKSSALKLARRTEEPLHMDTTFFLFSSRRILFVAFAFAAHGSRSRLQFAQINTRRPLPSFTA